MEIVPVVDPGLGNSAYVVDLGDGGALIVDPQRDPRPYTAALGQRGLAARFVVEKETVASGLPAFESEWAAVSRALAAGDRGTGRERWGRSRAAVRALAEAAEGRVLPLLEGARGFAVATQPKDGLLYMGQAQGEAEFAALCASLTFRGKVGRYPLRSMLPELLRLQEKTNAAFRPPRSIELHDRFIALNASLKAGRELDASESYAGSAYQYLEAVRHYGMLDAPPSDGTGQDRVRADLAADDRRRDHGHAVDVGRVDRGFEHAWHVKHLPPRALGAARARGQHPCG